MNNIDTEISLLMGKIVCVFEKCNNVNPNPRLSNNPYFIEPDQVHNLFELFKLNQKLADIFIIDLSLTVDRTLKLFRFNNSANSLHNFLYFPI